VRDRLPRPAAVAAGRSQCKGALDALESWFQAPAPDPAPLPQPRRLEVEPIDVVPDFVLVAGEALAWLASMDGATLTKWVVGGTWSQAVTRMAAAVEAWSRWGPYGDGSLMAELEPRPLLESIGHDEVAVASRTTVRRPAAPAEAGGSPDAGDASSQAEGTSEDAGVDEPVEARTAEVGIPVAVPGTDEGRPDSRHEDARDAREEPRS